MQNNTRHIRFLSYFLLVFSLIMVYSDAFAESNYSQNQQTLFKISDLCLLAIAIFMLISSHLNIKSEKINVVFYQVNIALVFISCIIWAVSITIIESVYEINYYTYALGVIASSFIVTVRYWKYLLFIVLGFISFIAAIFLFDYSITEIHTVILPVLGANIIAIFIFSLLQRNYAFQYTAHMQLKEINDRLENAVKKRTKELSETNIQLRHERDKAHNAVALKNKFLAKISHEIRTPLNGIIGFSELMENVLNNPEKARRYLHVIHQNGNALITLIDNIIHIALIETSQLSLYPKKLNFKSFIDEYVFDAGILVEHSQKPKLKFACENLIEDNNFIIYNDDSRVKQILNALLHNAIKHTNEGNITLVTNKNETEIIFSMYDTGEGINPEMQNIIFEAFRQVDDSNTEKGRGLGLGLTLAKGIVEQMGGRITFDQQYTRGAKFIVHIPINIQASA